MEILDIFNIVKAVVSVGLGIAKSVNEVKIQKAQAKADAEQTQELVKERARKAQKLIQSQKIAFLKSGVYFEGTPEAIFNETYDFAKQDINALVNDSYKRQREFIRQGRTAFATNILGGFGSALSSLDDDFVNNNLSNYYFKLNTLRKYGYNTGGFGGVENPLQRQNSKIS